MRPEKFAVSLAWVSVLLAVAIVLPTTSQAQPLDERCIARAALARFTVISTKETNRRDLYLGSDVTVGTTDVAGSCNPDSGTCACPRLACAAEGETCQANSDCPDGSCSGGTCACLPVPCTNAGTRCMGDSDCLVAAPGRCDLATHACACAANAANCGSRGQSCSIDRDCSAPTQPLARSVGGVCGNDMLISAGNRMGLLATRGDVDFGAQSKCRILRIESEFANTPAGRVKMAHDAPFLGPTARGNDGSAACAPDSPCPGACVSGRRLVLGTGPQLFSSSDGQARRGLAGTGSSLNFRLCDAALTLLESTGGDRSYGPSPFQTSIEGYVALPSQRVVLGSRNCLACALATTADGNCSACAATDMVRTRARTMKIVITLSGGLQVVDLPSLALRGNSVLELRGQSDTVALIRVAKGLRLGGEAKIVLASNGRGNGALQVDKVLWVAKGSKGGRPNLSRASTFRGTLMASGRAGIRVGGAVLTEGALWSRKVSIGVQSVVQHHPFSELFPLPGSGSTVFTPVGDDLGECLATLVTTPTATVTNTRTPSSTETKTVFPTATATNTAKPSPTFSSTPMPSSTPSPSVPAPLPTATFVSTATGTATSAPTGTSTATSVPTGTATATSVATATPPPTLSPSHTASVVPTATPTLASQPTQTATSISTPTASWTPTASSVSTATATASFTVTGAATETASTLPTVTATASYTVTPIATAPSTATVAIDPAMSAPDLAITKFRVAGLAAQAFGWYFLDVKNVGTASTTGAILVRDTLPSTLLLQSVSGTGWDCSATTDTMVSCTHPGPVVPGEALPRLSIFVFVDAEAGTIISNTGTVSSPDDHNPKNDQSTDTTFIHLIC